MITHIYAVVEYWGDCGCSGKSYHYFSIDERDCIQYIMDNNMLEDKSKFDEVDIEEIKLKEGRYSV